MPGRLSLTQMTLGRVSIFLLCAVVAPLAASVHAEDWRQSDRLAAESWRAVESWTKEWVDESVVKLDPIVKRVESKLSTECRNHVRMTMSGLRTLKPWAVKMLDSWAKIPPGFTSGVASFFGDYDGCLAVANEDGQLRGQYCNIQTVQRVPKISKVHRLTVNSMFPEFAEAAMTNDTISQTYVRERLVWYYRYGYKFGVCLPSSCTINDTTEMAKEGLKAFRWEVQVTDCHRENATQLSLLQISLISCFVVLFVIVFISTLTDLMRKRNISSPDSVIHFSLIRNWQSLTSTSDTKSRFAFLDGMKAIVVHWTILLHSFSMYESSVLSGAFSAVSLISIPVFQIIMNAWVSVDTFFCMSGFLLGNSLLNSLERKDGKVNWTRLIIRRICRVSPVMWTVLGMMFLTPLLGNGPHWQQNFQTDIEKCKGSWLPIVLFVNNWVPYDRMCLAQSWYASCDLQLYILGLAFVYVLYKSPDYGFKVCLSAILLASLWLAGVVYFNDLQPTMIWETFDESFRDKMLKMTYFGPVPHLPSILIGILVSYIIHAMPKLHLGKFFVYICWISSCLTMLWVLLAAHPWHNGEWPTTVNAALYQGSHKVLWSMANAWIIYACMKGHGGLAEKLLSWSGFSTLGKLAFIMNIVNIPVIRFKNAILRRYINFGLADLYYDFLGHYSISFAISAVLYLAVEGPFSSLADSFLRDPKKEEKNKKK